MIVQRRPPWEAFHPVAELELMPFRDAGRGPSDFHLSIQDCLWGMWKAMQNGLCDMNEFSVEEYEYYEKVEHGDWNWITPGFIAFASPVDPTWVKAEKERKAAADAENVILPPEQQQRRSSSGTNTALTRKLPMPFLNCLEYFEKRSVRLVVRLNTELYDRQVFLDRGIDHVDLYFDDGTNPTDEITRTFIDMADEVISGGGAVAVHVSILSSITAPLEPYLCTVQSRSWAHWDTHWGLHDLEVRFHSERGNRVHANRSARLGRRAAATLHVSEAARVDQVVRRRRPPTIDCLASCKWHGEEHRRRACAHSAEEDCHTGNTSGRGCADNGCRCASCGPEHASPPRRSPASDTEPTCRGRASTRRRDYAARPAAQDANGAPRRARCG
jgi:hypothetical protein